MSSGLIKLLDQHQFDTCAAAWSHHVSRHEDLTSVFQQPDGSPMRALCFSFEALLYLLSTVGARRIKAQFLLKEDEESGTKHFSVALYATDASDGRISAYYSTQYLSAPGPATSHYNLKDADGAPASAGQQIPNALVQNWVTNWKNAPLITAAMFSSTYGPLTGYTFEIDDFLDSFFYANKFKDKDLVLIFGLHKHYPAFPDCYAVKQTFGLVLRIRKLTADTTTPSPDFSAEQTFFSTAVAAAKTHAELAQAVQQWQMAYDDDEVGQPFYDFSRPSPPY
jgi:hypothetical protein